jgi:hypothetical protein
MGGACSKHAEKSNACRILVGKSEGKRPLGTPRRKWEHNIEMNLGDIRWSGTDWIRLAQDADQWKSFVSMVMNEFYLLGYNAV